MAKMFGKQSPQTTDEWMYSVADRKSRKTQTFKKAMRQPHKYIRKYQTAAGNTVYVYPEGHQAEKSESSWKFWK